MFRKNIDRFILLFLLVLGMVFIGCVQLLCYIPSSSVPDL